LGSASARAILEYDMPEKGSDDGGPAAPEEHVTPVSEAEIPLTPAEFEEMTLALADRLHGSALRLTRNRADADDLVQDTVLRAWRSIGSFRRGTRFHSWIFRILHNAFLNRVRHEAQAPAAQDPDTLDAADRAETVPDVRSLGEFPALADRHFDDRVKAAVDALPTLYREPFVLFSLGDLTYEEIAATLDVPIGTVMSRLHRARAALRERLASYARDERHPGGRP
jgi:RNA polymerase sigma-70 factor (ECF subfamily)